MFAFMPSVSDRVDKAEQVLVVGARALEVEAAVELILAAEGLVEARLQRVLMVLLSTGAW